MSDCALCKVPELIGSKMPAWCIGIPEKEEPENNNYLRVAHIKSSEMSHAEFLKAVNFTPGARLQMSLEDANKLINHRNAWYEVSSSEEPYGVIFDSQNDLENKDLVFRFENLDLPKDWDVIKISDSQYILSKRAANTYIRSSLQFHDHLPIFLESFAILKVFSINGVRSI